VSALAKIEIVVSPEATVNEFVRNLMFELELVGPFAFSCDAVSDPKGESA
jgi:hypothetical protein